jgi:hypothetical protein
MSDATLTEKTTITYNDILAPGDFVTGVRQVSGANNPVVLTGNHPDPTTGKPQALIYQGPLFPTSDEGYAFLTPVFFGQTVTTSTFYGPNTPLFNPGMGKNNIRAVGSYKYAEASDPQADHGMMYEGALDGSGAWTALNVPKDVAGGVVFSTIPHSTMGDLVVGNYDLSDDPGSASAFVYDLRAKTFTKLSLGPLTTAYGIWQNDGDGSDAYTIVGGYLGQGAINVGFMLDYDAATKAISNLTTYNYNGDPKTITHFEGISAISEGYALAATTEAGAAYAVVERSPKGGFGAATWTPVQYPGFKDRCTGNTVIDNHLMGIVISKDGVQSYLATID